MKHPDIPFFRNNHAASGDKPRRVDRGSGPSGDDHVHSTSRREIIKLVAGGALGGIATAVALPVNANVLVGDGLSTRLATVPKVDLDRKGIQLVFTGCDCAFPAPLSAGASFAVVIDGRVLQFGFGRGVIQNLSMAGIDPMEIDEMYLTRLSVDCLAEYNYYVATSMIAGRRKELQVFGPPGTRACSDIAAESLQKAMHQQRRHVHDHASGPGVIHGRPNCKVTELAAGSVGHKDVYRITVSRGGAGYGEVTSLVYRLDSAYGSIALSTGAGPSEAMERLARDVDILVHHFTGPDHGSTADESSRPEARHSDRELISAAALGKFASRANVKMLVPWHAPVSPSKATPTPSPSELSEAIGQYFSGAVVVADDSMIYAMT